MNNASALNETLVLGTLSGMRSMAGVGALAVRHGGLLARVMPVLAIGEMIADKTSFIGNRTDPAPLAGRAVMGAVAGGVIAREKGHGVVFHALLGGVTAILATHLAFQLRKRLPLPSLLGGLVEDGIVVAIASRYASLSPAGQDA